MMHSDDEPVVIHASAPAFALLNTLAGIAERTRLLEPNPVSVRNDRVA